MERDQSQAYRRAWIVIGVVIAVGHIVYASWRVSVGHADLIDFHDTSLHWWRTGEFTQEFGVRHYLPAFVVLIAPLVAWPLPVTAPVWAALNVVLLVLTIRECNRVIAERYEMPLPFSVRWVWPIVLVFPYLSSTLSLGQVNLLVLYLCVLAYSRCWQPRRDILAGLLIAVATIIKLYPLVLALFWLASGRWRGFLSATIGFVVLAAGLSLAGFGWEGSLRGHREWLTEVRGEQYRSEAEKQNEPGLCDHLLYREQRNQFHRHNNQSLAAVVRRLTTDLGEKPDQPRPVHLVSLPVRSAWWLYVGSVAALLALLIWATWSCRRESNPFGPFAAWLASVVAYVPIYWTHYFVLVLPAIVLLCAQASSDRQHGRKWSTPVIIFIAWLVSIPLLGSPLLRLLGVQCLLTLAIAIWAAIRNHKSSIETLRENEQECT